MAPVSGCIGKAELSVQPMAVDFGSISVTASSSAAVIEISNTGAAESGTISAIITGVHAEDFSVQNGCTTLASMGTCVTSVVFKPISAGARTANLVVSSSPGGTVMVVLTGTATN